MVPMVRNFIITVLLLTLLDSTGNAQESSPKITQSESREVERIARLFSQRLEQTKDLTPLIEEFLVSDFIGGYLKDTEINRFLIVKREVALQVSRDELLRYYIVSLNVGYLHSVYIHSKYPSTSNKEIPDERLFPPDVTRLIKNHPYTATYKDKVEIQSVEQLRGYTDLWEKAGALLRKRVVRSKAEKSKRYRITLADWGERFNHYQPEARNCNESCLGLPKGTRLITVNIPVFQLELAMIGGKMKIVSAMYYFQ
jgi:hypothetical protein